MLFLYFDLNFCLFRNFLCYLRYLNDWLFVLSDYSSINHSLAKCVLITKTIIQGAQLVVVFIKFKVANHRLEANLLSCIIPNPVNVNKMDMQQIVRWQIVEVGVDLVLRHTKLSFDCLVTFCCNVLQQRQVSVSQVSYCK
jgi:hypothetical protein